MGEITGGFVLGMVVGWLWGFGFAFRRAGRPLLTLHVTDNRTIRPDSTRQEDAGG